VIAAFVPPSMASRYQARFVCVEFEPVEVKAGKTRTSGPSVLPLTRAQIAFIRAASHRRRSKRAGSRIELAKLSARVDAKIDFDHRETANCFRLR